jgi:hypothetical protein
MFVRRLEMWERRRSVAEGSSPLLGVRPGGGGGEEDAAPCFRSVAVGESAEGGEGCDSDC